MRLGRKSLLFGCHQFLLHPIFTLWAWIKINRLLNRKLTLTHVLAAFIHDWGYWWAVDMDGTSGSGHSVFGANLIYRFTHSQVWYEELLCHSRFFAKRMGLPASNFCWVDKLGVALMPSWLWATLAYLTGEGREYLNNKQYEIYKEVPYSYSALIQKHKDLKVWTITKMTDYYNFDVLGQ